MNRPATHGNITELDPDELLTPPEASRLLGLSEYFLEKRRRENNGPAYIRISSRCIRYRRADLIVWIENNRLTCMGNLEGSKSERAKTKECTQ